MGDSVTEPKGQGNGKNAEFHILSEKICQNKKKEDWEIDKRGGFFFSTKPDWSDEWF